MTPAGIEPATLRFVAQHLNHCATALYVGAFIYLFIYLHYLYWLTNSEIMTGFIQLDLNIMISEGTFILAVQ